MKTKATNRKELLDLSMFLYRLNTDIRKKKEMGLEIRGFTKFLFKCVKVILLAVC